MNLFRSKICASTLVIAASICAPLQSRAAYNVYLSIAGIPGPATNNQIVVAAYSFGLSNPEGAQVFSWNYTQFDPTGGLARTNVSSIWDFVHNIGSSSGSAPVFLSTGIRQTTGVELDWNGASNSKYRIYAVQDLSQPFVPIAQITTASNGPASYFVTPAAPAMFYVVEQLPSGY